MENLIYPKPSEITFDLSGWMLGDTMFDRCSVKIPTFPSSTQSLDAPSFEIIQIDDNRLHVSFSLAVDNIFGSDDTMVNLVLFSFPVMMIGLDIPSASTGITWSIREIHENALATELKLGKPTLASVCEYEPITRRRPGNIDTAHIDIFIPGTAYGNFMCDMDIYPAAGVILRR